MSSPFAVAGVTAVLQSFLTEVYNNNSASFGGTVTVSSVAPDIVQADVTDDSQSGPRVNLFLHQITLNPALRNLGMPSVDSTGTSRLTNPPLALDLHYLLTTYSEIDGHAEALLALAVFFLHQNPVIPREAITTAFASLSATLFKKNFIESVTNSGLAEQLEMIKIIPDTLGREEVAWIWTALKADYRPTFPFQVSVVLVQAEAATPYAMPVLSRNINALSGAPPSLSGYSLTGGQMVAVPGNVVTLQGVSLNGVTAVVLTYARIGIPPLSVPPTAVTNNSVTFTIPTGDANLAAGIFALHALIAASGATPAQSTNSIAFAIGANLSAVAATQNTGPASTTVTLTCDPPVWSNQAVSLSMGGTPSPLPNATVPLPPMTAASTTALSFDFTTQLPEGTYLPILRVDGVDSPVSVAGPVNAPTYSGLVTVPNP